MKIYCVVPAYNEEKSIGKTLLGLEPLVDGLVVVIDGSSDRTPEIVSAFSAEHKKAVVLSHLINRGQGAALRTGTRYALLAGADIIVHFDGDGQFLPEEVAIMVSPLVKGEADIVFGSRFAGKEAAGMPFSKKYIIFPLARIFNYIFLRSRLRDPQNGFRAFTAATAGKIKWEQDRMSHCSEIISLAFSNNLRVKEVPVSVFYRRRGQSFGGAFKILKDFFLRKLIK